MSLHSVYTCEDFKVSNGALIIWGAKEVAKVVDEDSFKRFYDILTAESGVLPNAIVCPYLLQNSEVFYMVIFK